MTELTESLSAFARYQDNESEPEVEPFFQKQVEGCIQSISQVSTAKVAVSTEIVQQQLHIHSDIPNGQNPSQDNRRSLHAGYIYRYPVPTISNRL